MKVGVVANSDVCVPLLYFLKSNNIAADLFFGAGSAEDKGRAQVQEFCKAQQVPITSEKSADDLYSWTADSKPDVVFVAGYSSRINLTKLPVFSGGIYNIHFGMLPEYRGANPVFWQLKNNAANIGLTIHQLDQAIDAGPVVWTKDFPNLPSYTYTLVNKLMSNALLEGVQMILQTYLSGLAITAKPQEENNAKTYSRPGLADVSINWLKMSASEITALVKATNSWNVGAITVFNGMEVKIIDAAISDKKGSDKAPGTVLSISDTIEVVCADETVAGLYALSIDSVYMPARFASGFGLEAGRRFD